MLLMWMVCVFISVREGHRILQPLKTWRGGQGTLHGIVRERIGARVGRRRRDFGLDGYYGTKDQLFRVRETYQKSLELILCDYNK